jgi:hypothetical protein
MACIPKAHLIPSGPFAAWLNTLVDVRLRGKPFPEMKSSQDSALKELCDLLVWVNWEAKDPYDAGLRRLYRYRRQLTETNTGTKNYVKGPRVVKHCDAYDRRVVEDGLHHAGVGLEELYPPERFPALYEDIPLEAEAWCPNCQDSCSPIRGFCPWCDWRVRDVAEEKKAA